jgi:hypothetical protein
MELANILGPLSRIICLLTIFAWIPLLFVLYIQWKWRGSPTIDSIPKKQEQHNGKTP